MSQKSPAWPRLNRATGSVTAVLGVMVGIGNIDHGFFAMLQGYNPIDGLIFDAIGPEHIMWKYGGEAALTLIPNYLITGIAAVLVGIAIIYWSVGHLHRKRGPLVFLVLAVVSWLVGGGIAQLFFFVTGWIVMTRIRRPLTGWRRITSAAFRRTIRGWWPPLITIGAACFLVGLFIAITGIVPGVQDPEVIINICWSFLGAFLILFLLSAFSAFSDDVQRMDGAAS